MKRKIAIFIDWNGTLSPTNFWSHLEKSEKKKDRSLFKVWADTMFLKHKEKIIPWMRGKYTTEEMLTFVSKDTRTQYSSIFEEFVVGCRRMEYSSPNIPVLIEQLRNRSAIVSIATNNMDSFSRWTVPSMKLDFLFDEILNSYNLKALKHDLDKMGRPLFFRDFFKKYSINPKDCYFIDDGEDKMGVISNLGMTYRKINKKISLEKELRKLLSSF